MSKKDALTFLEKLERDNQFKTEFAKLKSESDLKKMEKKHHLIFTKEEFKQAYKEKHNKKLTHDDLSKIIAAGGAGTAGTAAQGYDLST